MQHHRPRASPDHHTFHLTATGIHVRRGAQLVLNDVSISVDPSSRIGLVGPNGIGKSTLLGVLAGLVQPDAGTVRRRPAALTVGHLPQEAEVVPGETLRASLARRTGVAAAEAEMDRLELAMGEDPTTVEAYMEALDRFVALSGPDLEARTAEVCAVVGIQPDHLELGLEQLSGGQAARAALAAILLSQFDVLLLDEPTNDLDFEGLDLLRSFVASLPGGVVLVSHDRDFLRGTVRRVVELEAGAHRAIEYSGGWEAYVAARREARRHRYEAYERGVAERKRLLAQARAQRARAASGANRARRRPPDPDRSLRSKRIEGAQNLAAKAKVVERKLERLEIVKKPWEGWDLRMSLAASRRGSDVVARLEGAVLRRGTFALGPVDLEVRWGDRLAVLGPNGSGKTTLLHAITGELPMAAGRRVVGPGIVIGEMDQRRATFDLGQPLLDAFCRRTGLLPEEARSVLAKFDLGAEDVLRPAGSLSAGERSRAILASLMARDVNCLILDEPTNHLDLPAIEELESALAGFDGPLILVTHDRALLDGVRITRTLSVESGGLVRDLGGAVAGPLHTEGGPGVSG